MCFIMHNWLRWNVFHNSKSVFMWLSICEFGMIIDTHPLLSEALGNCHPKLDLSWTWFRTDESTLIPPTLRHTTGSQIKFGMTGYASASLGRGCIILWHNVIQQHCGWAGLIFITHPFMNLELRNEVLRKPIMNCFIVKAPSSNPSSRYSSSRTWSSSWTRFRTDENTLKLSTLRHTSVLNQVQDDDGSSPGWQLPSASLERGCIHHSLFIMHCSLCIVHYALFIMKRSSA